MGCLGDEAGTDVRAGAYRLLRHLIVDQHDVNQLQTRYFDLFLIRSVRSFEATRWILDSRAVPFAEPFRATTSSRSRRSRQRDSFAFCFHYRMQIDRFSLLSSGPLSRWPRARTRSSAWPAYRPLANFVRGLVQLWSSRYEGLPTGKILQ